MQLGRTRETAQIAMISLHDAARLGSVPYDNHWVDQIRWREPTCQPLFGNLFPIATDLYGCFLRTAHIAGAVSISFTWGPQGAQRTILFSGDLGVNEDGREQQGLLKYRMDGRDVDYAVCESTYGNVEREPVSYMERLDALDRAIEPILAQRGVGIVPVFSIGRCQDLQLDLAVLMARHPERYRELDVVMHAPMGMRISEIYAQAMERTEMTRKQSVKPLWLNPALGCWLGLDRSPDGERLARELMVSIMRLNAPPADLAQRFPDALAARIDARRIRRVDSKAKIDAHRPTVIICSSGMCNGGPVVDYLRTYLCLPTTSVIFPGFVGGGTLGHQVLALRDLGITERRKLTHRLDLVLPDGSTMRASDVQAHVVAIAGYSGHADRIGLSNWLLPPKTGKPVAKTVFLTHGLDQARQAFSEHIRLISTGAIEVVMPQSQHGDFDLDLHQWIGDNQTDELLQMRERIRALEAEVARRKRA